MTGIYLSFLRDASKDQPTGLGVTLSVSFCFVPISLKFSTHSTRILRMHPRRRNKRRPKTFSGVLNYSDHADNPQRPPILARVPYRHHIYQISGCCYTLCWSCPGRQSMNCLAFDTFRCCQMRNNLGMTRQRTFKPVILTSYGGNLLRLWCIRKNIDIGIAVHPFS